MKKVWIRLLCLLLVGELLGAMLPGALPQAAAASRQVNIKVDSVKHCDVYYCEGDGLIPIQQGGKIDKITTGNYAILFFAAPHSGYALSAMTATSAAGEYYTISDGASNGAGSEFYSYGSGKNVSNLKNAGYTDSQIERILTDAIAKGCDGALLFSRPASNGAVIGSNLIFGAERLPTLEKHIKSVTPKSGGQAMPYTEGMSVGLGDIINYSLDVTFYPLENKEFSIAYNDVYVTDEKTGNTEAAPIRITAPTAEDLKGLIQEKLLLRRWNIPLPSRMWSRAVCAMKHSCIININRCTAPVSWPRSATRRLP